MERVKAKFVVEEFTESSYGRAVKLRAVVNGPGNESWSKWTPSGSLQMTITNPAAAAFFTVGKQVFIDFTEADS